MLCALVQAEGSAWVLTPLESMPSLRIAVGRWSEKRGSACWLTRNNRRGDTSLLFEDLGLPKGTSFAEAACSAVSVGTVGVSLPPTRDEGPGHDF
jgi:hypothetical protein